MTPDEHVRLPTAAHLVAAAIRKQIVTGALADGDRLPPEAELLGRYGISRPTLREAIRILQSESLVTIRRGSRGGALVNAPRIRPLARQAGYLLQYQRTNLADVYRARLVIEPAAAAWLAEERSPGAVAELDAALADEAGNLDDPVAFGHAAARFHELVVEHAGNKTLALVAGIVAEIIDVHAEQVLADPRGDPAERARRSHADHAELLRRVREGDTAGAQQHWLTHLEGLRAYMEREGFRTLIEVFGDPRRDP